MKILGFYLISSSKASQRHIIKFKYTHLNKNNLMNYIAKRETLYLNTALHI